MPEPCHRDPRAEAFGLLPEESQAAWTRHVHELHEGYRPVDATESKLVTAIAAAMWMEGRADRIQAEVLADIRPACPGRSHGSDLQDRDHAAALSTVIRLATAAGCASARAQRAFLAHRKAKAQGLLAATAAPPMAANENCTNDLPPAPSGQVVASPPPRPAPEKPRLARVKDPDPPEEELDDAAWLASLPVVEADPEREAERRTKLMQVEPPVVRRMIGHAPLAGIEHYLVANDPVAYEEWFARQPKPPREEAAFMTEEDVALVKWVTRHNPPWARGQYLGYYRPPVPAHLFLPGAVAEEPDPPRPACLPAPAVVERSAPATPLADLRARVARLLDRAQPRLAEELDLAEAVCAARWPNWPAYKGPVDPSLLRRALEGVAIDTATLHWLGSQELAQACKAAGQA